MDIATVGYRCNRLYWNKVTVTLWAASNFLIQSRFCDPSLSGNGIPFPRDGLTVEVGNEGISQIPNFGSALGVSDWLRFGLKKQKIYEIPLSALFMDIGHPNKGHSAPDWLKVT